MSEIAHLDAIEILDSRGRPTVLTICRLASGAEATVSVPSGASTGAAEAVELRDGDSRQAGLGCRRAVAHVRGEIADRLRGKDFDQTALDRALVEADGTPNKSRLGANAILSVSLAFARAVAAERGVPLYAHFADLVGESPRLPRPIVNLYSGGKHAGGQVAIQDVLLLPETTTTIADTLDALTEVYRVAADNAARDYGMRLLTADEGGQAPPFPGTAAMFESAVQAIADAGLTQGMALAADVAATHFYDGTRYAIDAETLDANAMIDTVSRWVDDYPLRLVEDGLAEDDWEHWPTLRQRLAGKAATIGDDLLTTNPQRITRAVQSRACDALLLKVNQIGSLSEAATARRLAKDAGWRIVVSARSGETEDDWLADLATGWAADHIKVGSITQSERLAKYNRLLRIEHDTQLSMT